MSAALAENTAGAVDLVIGLGNPLRQDDGLGWWLARRARQLRPAPAVELVQQLTPELAATVAAARRVLVVDAWRAPTGTLGPCLRPLAPLTADPAAANPAAGGGGSHHLAAAELIALARQLWPRQPALVAWELLVPASRFGHNSRLSPQLRAWLGQAELLLQRWCAGSRTTIGIDVGGARKGFHAVALHGGAYAGQLASGDAEAVSRWCHQVMGAEVIAIDAPGHWSADGRPRACERQLLARGIRCFTSPTRAAALAHASNYYGWMLQGEALYRALAASHPLLTALPAAQAGPCCFETFPHAITWHLRGGNASAADKRRQRSALLRQAGIDPAPLTSIDRLDAALCALAAHHVAGGGPCHPYGEPASGLIVVPQGPAGPPQSM